MKQFPNGFPSWKETHYEVVAFITSHMIGHNDSIGNPVFDVHAEQGTGGLYEMAEKWTDEFEKLNKGREWDGEFFDEIGKFLKQKLE